MHNILRRIPRTLPLLLACMCAIGLALPTIGDYIDDPNLITYFSGDEGGQMDLAWLYYGGERRNSLQWEYDYGLEVLYIADVARIVIARFTEVTPGIFVWIARWIHLLGWLAALWALWGLVGRHLKPGWPQTVAVTLLSVRPAFAYLLNNWKPDPILLVLIIVGLDYLLRNIQTPKWRYLSVAMACAALAFVLKYAGIFLIPPAVASMYFAQRQRAMFPTLRSAWALYVCTGVGMLALMLVALGTYVRVSTGMTWYQEYGLWGAVEAHPAVVVMSIGCVGLIALSVLLRICMAVRQPAIRQTIQWVNQINSYALIATGIFMAFVVVFGFRWLISPEHFIASFSQLVSRATGTESLQQLEAVGWWSAFSSSASRSIRAFDPWILGLLMGYLVLEFVQRHVPITDHINRYKRYTLLIFLGPFFLVVATMVRVAQHHMLPFFVATCILILYGMSMVRATIQHRGRLALVMGCIIAVLCVDVAVSARAMWALRQEDYRQRHDVVHDLTIWWHANIPKDARVISDHYTRVYVPPAYDQIRVFKSYQGNVAEQLRSLMEEHQPSYVYYNAGPSGGSALPLLEDMIPEWRVELVKEFRSYDPAYERIAGDRFLIYRVDSHPTDVR